MTLHYVETNLNKCVSIFMRLSGTPHGRMTMREGPRQACRQSCAQSIEGGEKADGGRQDCGTSSASASKKGLSKLSGVPLPLPSLSRGRLSKVTRALAGCGDQGQPQVIMADLSEPWLCTIICSPIESQALSRCFSLRAESCKSP